MGLDGQPSEAFENETAFLERLSIMMKYVAPKETGWVMAEFKTGTEDDSPETCKIKQAMAKLEISIKESMEEFINETKLFPEIQVVSHHENVMWSVRVESVSTIGHLWN